MSAGGAATAGSRAPAARLHAVRKRFGYRDVLRGVDLEVRRGGCLAVFGPNGAGKSTLLRIIATQWRHSSGSVEVLGSDAAKDALSIRRRIGLVFHESFLRRELTLEENLRFACDLHGLARATARERIGRLLAMFNLENRRRDAVRTFSQGMVKRASLARSLLHEPELWILDEPFSGLDLAGRERLEGLIRDFAAGPGTVLLVTHDFEAGRRLATSSAYVQDGKVLRQGTGASAAAASTGEGEPG